jgi:hypothetical protein
VSFERCARALAASFGIAVGEDSGIHRSGRSAGNAVELHHRHLKRPIEDAPRECPMGATTL